MAKTISFEYEGNKYVLEYTRASVMTMERQGFNIKDIEDKPISTLPSLFQGAFIAHHPGTKKTTIDAIYSKLANKMDLVLKLAEMYNEPIEALIDDPEDKEGKLEWGTNW